MKLSLYDGNEALVGQSMHVQILDVKGNLQLNKEFQFTSVDEVVEVNYYTEGPLLYGRYYFSISLSKDAIHVARGQELDVNLPENDDSLRTLIRGSFTLGTKFYKLQKGEKWSTLKQGTGMITKPVAVKESIRIDL